MTSRRPPKAPTGMPPPMILPRVVRSGRTPYRACAQGPLQDVGVVRLKVTSLSATPLEIVYDLQGTNAEKIPVWSYVDSSATRMPGQTRDKGAVNVSPTHVDKGARVVPKRVTLLP